MKMMNVMNSKALLCSRKRGGFVLVSVLMLGVLLISCATAFSWFVRQQAKTVGGERINITARSMAHVIVTSAINLLSEMASHIGYDSPTQRWYKPFVVQVDDIGMMVVQITPLDDKIPIRNLFLPDGNTLRRELEEPMRKMWESLRHRELENILLDFLDRNTRSRVGSTERDNFINRPPFDMSELLILSQDISPALLYGSDGVQGIEDYCTIYSDGRINLNVAPVHVMELLPGLDTGGLAERIAQVRLESPLETLQDVESIPGASARVSSRLTNIVAFKSRYFQVSIDVINEADSGIKFDIIFDRTTKQIVRWEES